MLGSKLEAINFLISLGPKFSKAWPIVQQMYALGLALMALFSEEAKQESGTLSQVELTPEEAERFSVLVGMLSEGEDGGPERLISIDALLDFVNGASGHILVARQAATLVLGLLIAAKNGTLKAFFDQLAGK